MHKHSTWNIITAAQWTPAIIIIQLCKTDDNQSKHSALLHHLALTPSTIVRWQTQVHAIVKSNKDTGVDLVILWKSYKGTEQIIFSLD